ncbi:MAG: DciA family protein [Leptospiraceae bacterium]|nr:DciA family protein [Leptospiraceae bacterium]MDW7976236.1 hypothetical protein [Leptospiraceae bacterium]
MNIDHLYTEFKPRRLTRKEKEKVLELLFGEESADRKIEEYLEKHWKKFFGRYASLVKMEFVKNKTLYVSVPNKLVLQEILFQITIINDSMKRDIDETIRGIKELHPTKRKKETKTTPKTPISPNKNSELNEKSEFELKKKFLLDLQKIIKNR